ncbi:MAG TPA: hypothetical protein VMW29_03385 [Candidatus Bathyarchaeia archaeon]|nr:hypothetical protein [Candidatus Bathyarchaeia archaeon]
MIDPIQILLIFVITTLTILLFIIGLEVFQILKELKKTVEKVNKILTDSGRISEAVAQPIEEASDFIMGLQKGLKFFKTVSDFFKKEKAPTPKDSEEEEIQEADEVNPKEKASFPSFIKAKKYKKAASVNEKEGPKKSKRRFFTRKGKSLGK